MADQNVLKTPEVITTEVESSAETVAAARADIPVGVAGAPIDRIPLNAQLSAMANAGTYTSRIASTDRCIRIVEVPLRGGETAKFHCSRACVSVGNMKYCPDHDKGAFQPNQTPHGTIGRVLNAASIPLTKAEKDELTKTSKSYAEHGDNPLPTIQRTEISPAPASSAGSLNPPVDALHGVQAGTPYIQLRLTLPELAGREILDVLRDRICEALDGMPCGNVREMKQIVALQESVAKIGKQARRRVKHERTIEG